MSNINNSQIRVNINENNEDDTDEEFIYRIYSNIITQPVFQTYYRDESSNRTLYNRWRMTPDNIIRTINRVSSLNVMSELFGNMMDIIDDDIGISEEKMIEIAERESLNHYKTQEKKPHIKLDINESIATEQLKNENCTICVTNFEVGEKITELECKHILHTNCISEWVKYKSECPVCRHSVKTIDESIKTTVSDEDIISEGNLDLLD